jgi:lysophospholipid acyltransferase (LPLAT)-like uncharacterized protein
LSANFKTRLISSALLGYYILLLKTCRITRTGWHLVSESLSKNKGLVFGVPHCVLLPAVLSFDGRSATFLASQSKDGELISRLLLKRGFRMARGSSSRGGAVGLETLVQAVEQGEVVGLTFDGPRGPEFVPKPGVGILAWQSKEAFLLAKVRVHPRRFLWWKVPFAMRLRSWDRFVLLFPFCHFSVEFLQVNMPPALVSTGWERHLWIRVFLEELEKLTRTHYSSGV